MTKRHALKMHPFSWSSVTRVMNKTYGSNLDSLFVFPPGGVNGCDHFFYNIGSAYIISYLRQHGYKAEQFICSEPVNLQNCIKKILLLNPRVIGFTVFNTNFLTSVLIAAEIRKIFPDKSIVFGGPTATSNPEFILERYPFIDVCFRNEGEETFLQFLSCLNETNFNLRKTALTGIKGITYRQGDNILTNPDSDILAQNSRLPDYLDKYPSPYLSGVIPGSDAFTIGLLTARGCNQHCTYCNCAVLSKRKITTHSVERVISELDYLSGYNDHEGGILSFYDDAFSLIPERAKRICREIIENRIRLPLSCITRCDCADEELIDLMKEAGFVSLAFSLESANPKTLRILGKVHKAEDNPSDTLEKEVLFIEKHEKMTAYAKKAGIKSVFSSVMSGLPLETLEQANKTIEKIDSSSSIDSFAHNLLSVYPGTPLNYSYSKYGYKIELPDNNPIFSKTVYPDDVVYKIKTSPKSHYRGIQKRIQNNTLRILSLTNVSISETGGVNSIILFSDTVTPDFVEWLTLILSLNGTIIQMYSGEAALTENCEKNFEIFVKGCSPSLDIRNYYLERKGSLLFICNHSPLIRNEEDRVAVKVGDFSFVRSNFPRADVDFVKFLCRESGTDDAASLHEYLSSLKEEKNLFSFMIRNKPFPYFANLCKWTRNSANCISKNTLFINEMSEVRLCWDGPEIGKVGQNYNDIIESLETLQKLKSEQRKCNTCSAEDRCTKCLCPSPLTVEGYCEKQRKNDISEVVEMFFTADIIKQYI